MPAPAPVTETPAPAYGTTWRIVIPVAVLLLFVLGLFFYRTIFPRKPSSQLGPVRIEDAAPAPAPAEPVSPKPATSNPATSNLTTAKPAPRNPAPVPVPPTPTASAPTRSEVVHQVLPEVPQSARNTITGTIKVSVQVEVDPSGKVTAAKFKSAGPSKYFAGLAMKAAERWEFSAPVVDGKSTASAWVLQFRFKRTSTQASPESLAR